MKTELKGTRTSISFPNSTLFNNTQGSLSGALKGCLGSLDGACVEKLLLHCASALETNEVTLAQQVMWVLNNVASSLGDPNQRLTSWFLRALITRASRVCPTAMGFHSTATLQSTRIRSMSVTELAGYVDLIPWHRFGFCASNSTIYNAIQGHSKVHILDFSITHCMQWPTLIDALAKRPEGPPSLRITVPSTRPSVPPLLNVSNEEVSLRLANFAKSRDVPFKFHVIEGPSTNPTDVLSVPSIFHHEFLLTQLNPSFLDLKDDEILIVNCQNWLRYLPDDPGGSTQDLSLKDGFLEMINGLNPHMIVVVDEDSDLDSPTLTSRITACFNYLWIPFDALETLLPKDNHQRMEYEADVGHKIENMIAFDGLQRIERLESSNRLVQRMNKAHFRTVPFGEETMKEVKFLLDEHASGWGMKKDDETLVLTWKGHNSVFATAWVPCRFVDPDR
ncbi:scarecrow-like protein 32 [Magnolia sinica]|uniref:scarecrow-like protein 32 n=1 Tax=Magnolia sinica TaxID=86752 RepID=UPI002659E1E0|nr:scarecrow-like protein 32 [Magnolia sinica]